MHHEAAGEFHEKVALRRFSPTFDQRCAARADMYSVAGVEEWAKEERLPIVGIDDPASGEPFLII